MPQNDQTKNDARKAGKNNKRAPHAGLWWILVAGGVFLVTLLFVSTYLPGMSERVKFFTVNALSILILTAIAVQAYIYRRQWKAMQGQLDAMEGQSRIMGESLVETRRMVEHNERAVKVAEESIEVARENTIYAQRAYLTVTKRVALTDGFLLRIRNVGNTPANDVHVRAVADVGYVPPPPPANVMENLTYIGSLSPRGTFDIVRFANNVTAEQKSLLSDPEQEFRVWCVGAIFYEDIFKYDLDGGARKTTFCYHQTAGSPSVDAWVTGNQAD